MFGHSTSSARNPQASAGPSQSIWAVNPVPAPLALPPPPAPLQKSAPVSLSALEKASRVLQDQLVADAQAVPELADMLQSHAPVPYSSTTDKTYAPFYRKRTVSIPDWFFELYDTTQESTMGLMPEIERAWISVGSKMYLWDYIDGLDMHSYVEQPYIIKNATLVRPRPGIFLEEMKYVIVICTLTSVALIGVACSPSADPSRVSRTQLKLYNTDMVINTDNNPMAGVVGTRSGRIFMYGMNDGCLYELEYSANESWFSSKIQLHNRSVGGISSFLPFLNKPDADRLSQLAVDDDRNCLYTLSTQNNITLYHLGHSGDQLNLVRTISGLRKAAQALFPGLPALEMPKFRITHIHVIEVAVSRNVHLVAFTESGVRLYFSHYRRNPYGPGLLGALGSGPRNPQVVPPGLELIQVRPPPTDLTIPDAMPPQGLTAANPPVIITYWSTSTHSAGLTLGTQEPSTTDGSDLLFCMCPDIAKMVTAPANGVSAPGSYGSYGNSSTQRPLAEYAAIVPILGHSWAMTETRRLPTSASPPASPAPNAMFELATQFSEPPRQFLIFTNVGLSLIVKRRAVDHLRQLLDQYDTDPRPAQTFCQNFGRVESAAMLLAIACGNSFLTHEGLEQGSRDEFSLTNINAEMSANAKLLFYSQGGMPALKNANSGAITDSQVIFSGRRDGLALYFARLVRPLWRAEIIKTGDHGRLEPNVFDTTLVTVQRNLDSLRSFLERNPTLFSSTVELRDPGIQEAWKVELASVAQLLGLLAQTIEAISFVLLLIDYQLSEVVGQCDQPTRDSLKTLTYEELISSKKGRDVARGLVNAIINHQIGRQISVDTISELLQQRCGSFCSADDVLMYKAIENIRKAKETRDPSERTQSLRTSFKFFSKGSANLEIVKLQEIVQEYKDLRYARGAIELPLKCARDWDANNLGHAYWAEGSPANDTRAGLYQKRVKCYDIVLDVLSVFSSMFENQPANVESLETEELALLRATAYQIAISSQDEVFHSYLYDWLLSKGMKDELVEIRTPYIESYLAREPVALERAELLHLFYVKTGQYLRAAETCAALAESPAYDIDLEKRIQLFSFAVNYAKSHPISELGRQEATVEFLTDLEEKLEVAQVQLEIFNELFNQYGEGSSGEGAAVRRLNKSLLTISELFRDYADPYELLEIKLLILHVSEHNDPAMVNAIWDSLFYRVIGDEPITQEGAKTVHAIVLRMGQRFYPSEAAFPVDAIVSRLESFTLGQTLAGQTSATPRGWAPRLLLEAGVSFGDVFNALNRLYDSQIPPFHVQTAVQQISGDIAFLISEWVTEATRPQSSLPRHEFPANLLDETIDLYLHELSRDQEETRRLFDNAKLAIRGHF